mgnify:CR=1 FL=1
MLSDDSVSNATRYDGCSAAQAVGNVAVVTSEQSQQLLMHAWYDADRVHPAWDAVSRAKYKSHL